MKVKKLIKIPLGKNQTIVRIIYGSFFGDKERDVFKTKRGSWKYSDTNDYCIHEEELLNLFLDSGVEFYVVNKVLQ